MAAPNAKLSGVYVIVVAPPNAACGEGGIYVGSSKDVRRRRTEHFRRMAQGTHTNWKLARDWKRYGQDAFAFFFVCHAPVNRLATAEQRILDSLMAHQPCYNIDAHAAPPDDVIAEKMRRAKKGKPLSEAHRAKLASIVRERYASGWTMPPVTDETRARLRSAGKGRRNAPEATAKQRARLRETWDLRTPAERARMGDIVRARYTPEMRQQYSERMRGRVVSDETRAKLAAARSGKAGPVQSEATKAKRRETWRLKREAMNG